MSESPHQEIGFAHQGQPGIARFSEKSALALSVQLGGQPNALAISSMADISYLGKPLVGLSSDKLQAATHLASSVLNTDVQVNRF